MKTVTKNILGPLQYLAWAAMSDCAQAVFALLLPVLAQLLSLICEPPQAQEVSEQGGATTLCSPWG